MQLPLEPLNQKLVVIGTVSPIVFLTVMSPALVREKCRWVREGRAVTIDLSASVHPKLFRHLVPRLGKSLAEAAVRLRLCPR